MLSDQIFEEDNPDLGPAVVIAGALAACAGIFFLYFGIRGLAGDRADAGATIADPKLASATVVAGIWMLSIPARLVRRGANKRPLLFDMELLVLSVLAILLGLWAAFVGALKALLMSFVGILGLRFWRSRLTARKEQSGSTAA
jgi:hypothetical protein